MSRLAPILTAIADHRAAYDAFQIAPDDEAESACCEMANALDALVLTACSFPVLTQPLPPDVGELLAHVRWWLDEEAVHADDYQPEYGILQARAADFDAVLRANCTVPPGRDPVFAAIAAADAAAADHTEALSGLDEDDDTQMRRANAAADAASNAFVAVEATTPTTWPGLFALVEFYGRDLELYDRCSHGGGYFGHLAASMLACDSSGAFWASTKPFSERKQRLARVIPQAVSDPSQQVAA